MSDSRYSLGFYIFNIHTVQDCTSTYKQGCKQKQHLSRYSPALYCFLFLKLYMLDQDIVTPSLSDCLCALCVCGSVEGR